MNEGRIRAISREAPVLIAGPTASGKSALALEIAARDGRVVVNADALQVYACWRVLTARPSVADEAVVPHRLYGHVGGDFGGDGGPETGYQTGYSVGHWLREVAGLLDRPVVIVGGTGLYFTALTEGLAPVPQIPARVRAEADALRLGDLAAMRAGLDAATAARIDLANPARVQRAWEVLRASGRGLAAWQAGTPLAVLPRARVEALVLRPDVGWLDARIARRFSGMLEAGALAEVAARMPHWDADHPSARAIGAAQLRDHLLGRLTLREAEAAAQLATRQYAKRQRTWFRSRMKDWHEVAAM